nr:MAG TPA: helix-turn-helix domain protein [Caudoviricetes sp.]
MDNAYLGKIMRRARKKQGLTQTELAEKAGVSTMTIRRYESGDRKPRLEEALKISRVLGLALKDLFYGPEFERFIREIKRQAALLQDGAERRAAMTKEQLNRIRKEYGDEYLYRQIAEECMELGHAALKLVRAQRGETPVSLGEAQRAGIDEAADVRVMLNVLDKMLDVDGRVRMIEQTAAKDRRMTERLLGE